MSKIDNFEINNEFIKEEIKVDTFHHENLNEQKNINYYNDELIIEDKYVNAYNQEISKIKIDALKTFYMFETKISNQNLINIAGKLLGFLLEEVDFLQEITNYLNETDKIENKNFIETLNDQITSLKVLYEIETFKESSKIYINSNLPLLRKCLSLLAKIIESLVELLNFELNSKIKEVLNKYLSENLELLMFLISLLQ